MSSDPAGVHPGGEAVISLHHAQVVPAVPFIKECMVGDEIKGIDPKGGHLGADHQQQTACQALPAERLLHIQGADIGGQIFAVVEVVFDDAYPAGDLAVFPRQIPLRDGVPALQAGVDALPVIFCGYAPFLMEPLGGLRGQLRVQTQG